ncbi:Retrotransposon Copia-like N-terminal protein [Dioscorea alata]|uniref:Retrotransposon Copia-like N-terminal protein n=1 Tax=Dioscorea alata TaxID=55571 RepID=A0ACB7WCB1_DIOAL|nr:Retrotransposon Copia-like N-terminal protein [Dioscorea alata]
MLTHTIPNDLDPHTPFIIVTLSNVIKLTSQNYLSWKLQIKATLEGYSLFHYLDGSFPAPPSTIVTDIVPTSNPAYLTWARRDRFLFGAIIGTLDQNIVPLIFLTTTTQQLWGTLAQTLASSS